MARKRKAFGMHHKEIRAHNAWVRNKRKKKIHVTVEIERGPSHLGYATYYAFACAKHKGKSVKGAHCSGLKGGTTPTKATAGALAELARSLQNAR